MRKKMVAANWKMNKNNRETMAFVKGFLPLPDSPKAMPEIVICPPFTCLKTLQSALQGSAVKIGGQDLFWENSGAFTGAIAAPMLIDCGCSYVIVGHSERRQVFNESDYNVKRKVKAALAGGLTPILCVGETLSERQNDLALQVVKEQLTKALSEIIFTAGNLVVAYEPVWAIGTGINSSPADAQTMIVFIREQLAQLYDRALADATSILYGGSVKAANMHDFILQADIDGALVGGASLDPREFSEIVRLVQNA